jgi:hypothetical protein
MIATHTVLETLVPLVEAVVNPFVPLLPPENHIRASAQICAIST